LNPPRSTMACSCLRLQAHRQMAHQIPHVARRRRPIIKLARRAPLYGRIPSLNYSTSPQTIFSTYSATSPTPSAQFIGRGLRIKLVTFRLPSVSSSANGQRAFCLNVWLYSHLSLLPAALAGKVKQSVGSVRSSGLHLLVVFKKMKTGFVSW